MLILLAEDSYNADFTDSRLVSNSEFIPLY